MNNGIERGITFAMGDSTAVGIVSSPPKHRRVGIVIVVGGPQYRVGSHRQFVHLARTLAAQGYPSLRFDFSGMGDSDGDRRNFELDAAEIPHAIETLIAEVPDLEKVVLFGLCDAASAILLGATRHPLVAGLILANPWVRTPAGLARARVKHYYGERLRSRAFWTKLLSGDVAIGRSIRQWIEQLRMARQSSAVPNPESSAESNATLAFPDRMARALTAYRGSVLLLLSGRDLTASEFKDRVQADAQWQQALAGRQRTRIDLDQADHTFSNALTKDHVAQCVVQWLDAEFHSVRLQEQAA